MKDREVKNEDNKDWKLKWKEKRKNSRSNVNKLTAAAGISQFLILKNDFLSKNGLATCKNVITNVEADLQW